MQGKLTALSILTLWTQAYKIPSSARVNVLILGMRSLGQVWSPDLVVILPREALVEGSSFDLDFGTWNFQLFWTANVYIVGSGLRLYAGQRKASWREKKLTQKMRHKMDFQLRRITDNTNLSASGYPQTQEKSERRCREKQLVSKDLVPFLPPYCSSCSDLQSLVILRTAVICPTRFSRLLADGFFPGVVILWSLNSLSGDWYPLGYHRECLLTRKAAGKVF